MILTELCETGMGQIGRSSIALNKECPLTFLKLGRIVKLNIVTCRDRLCCIVTISCVSEDLFLVDSRELTLIDSDLYYSLPVRIT